MTTIKDNESVDFTQLHRSLFENLRPTTPEERALVRRMAFASWRSSRANRLNISFTVTLGRIPFVLAFDRRALRLGEHWLNLHDKFLNLRRQSAAR